MSFNYSISGVFDVDQQWNALPEHGSMYCVPSAYINWMYYFATKGRLSAIPFANGQANHIRRNIAAMADYMDTDPEDGTSTSDTIDGLVDWSDDRNVPYIIFAARATDNDNITYVGLRNLLQMGAHVVVGRGRYELDDGEFDRVGGHAMTVVGLNRTSSGVITISVHNPWNDSNRTTQAPFNVQQETLTEKTRNIEGDNVKILRWGANSVNPPYLCIDGWTALLPMFAVSNVTGGFLTSYVVDIATGKVTDRKFPLPFRDEISELVLDPSAPFATVIEKGTGEVWTLSLGDGTWEKTQGITGAQRIVYGGRRQRMFVIKDRDITAIDAEGKIAAKLDAGGTVDAITYDVKGDRLIGLRGSRLVSIDPVAFKITGEIDAPVLSDDAVNGEGRISLSVNRRDQSILLSREGSPEVASVRWASKGAITGRRILLRTEGANAALHASHSGRVFISENNRIAAFDADGTRVVGSVFDGLPAGKFLKVARSYNPLDEERSKRKGWKN